MNLQDDIIYHYIHNFLNREFGNIVINETPQDVMFHFYCKFTGSLFYLASVSVNEFVITIEINYNKENYIINSPNFEKKIIELIKPRIMTNQHYILSMASKRDLKDSEIKIILNDKDTTFHYAMLKGKKYSRIYHSSAIIMILQLSQDRRSQYFSLPE